MICALALRIAEGALHVRDIADQLTHELKADDCKTPAHGQLAVRSCQHFTKAPARFRGLGRVGGTLQSERHKKLKHRISRVPPHSAISSERLPCRTTARPLFLRRLLRRCGGIEPATHWHLE